MPGKQKQVKSEEDHYCN
jgi:hypothetical protein